MNREPVDGPVDTVEARSTLLMACWANTLAEKQQHIERALKALGADIEWQREFCETELAPPHPWVRVDPLVEAAALAYGHLWHVNEERATPTRVYLALQASSKARVLLRGRLTFDQMRDGIDAAKKELK